MSTQSETREFQAETRQLLDLMVHSVYSDKDSFLRELISNASDALDKLRLESLVDKDLDVDTSDLHITLEPSSNDSAERILTIRDNGIGMSRDEVVELIGTLARSGTAELRAKLAQASDSAATEELIGQFGIGFYSTFMSPTRSPSSPARQASRPEPVGSQRVTAPTPSQMSTTHRRERR